MRRAQRLALAATAAVLATACATATPVGVNRTDPRQVHRELVANALSTNEMSAPTHELLTRLSLLEAYRTRPDATLASLHAGLSQSDDAGLLFALAELSFLQAARTGRRDLALASAVYAYAFLFPSAPDAPPDPFDPRLQTARHLYNRGLALGLRSDDGREVALASRTYSLPFGDLAVALDPAEETWAGFRLDRFVSAADLQVRGLQNRYRTAGVGAPLSASLGGPAGGPLPPGHDRIPARLKVPVTAFLRLADVRAGIASGHLRGDLELYSEDGRSELLVDGRTVPLETEKSSSLAYTLEGSPIWDFGFAGFRLGDFVPGGQTERLIFMTPYRPGRIPVVLVHGTFSSPATWAEMVNELDNDPVLSRRYQIWLFIYNTGNPIPYSGGLLVKSLKDVVAELDPDNRDPALRHMVVVGHSQGGLLTKLTVVDSGDRFWENVARKPLDEIPLSPATAALLRRSFFYERLPFVTRVVFMSTPHRGSYLADFGPAGWISRLVKMPVRITKLLGELAVQGGEGAFLVPLQRPPTSLDNMSSRNRFLQTLSEMPVAPGVAVNSIVAVRGAREPPFTGGADGVVRFESAHLPDAESELVVDSGHSVQQTERGINEVRRILLLHAAQSGLFPAQAVTQVSAPADRASAARAPGSRPAGRRARPRSSRSP
ncbi:MAG TPA: alpha/beta hydrolase [Myxococcota bacterium]|nr:alpha/beta hydrolase [Myxococcota bacterium]